MRLKKSKNEEKLNNEEPYCKYITTSVNYKNKRKS